MRYVFKIKNRPNYGEKRTITKFLLFPRIIGIEVRWLEHRPRGLVIIPKSSACEKFSHPNVIIYDGSEKSYNICKKSLVRTFER